VQGSNSLDVDAACLAALRRWRFTKAAGAAEIRGVQTIRITLR
jgi:outer membrane biosynthesis protein TonB